MVECDKWEGGGLDGLDFLRGTVKFWRGLRQVAFFSGHAVCNPNLVSRSVMIWLVLLCSHPLKFFSVGAYIHAYVVYFILRL